MVLGIYAFIRAVFMYLPALYYLVNALFIGLVADGFLFPDFTYLCFYILGLGLYMHGNCGIVSAAGLVQRA